MIPKIITRNNNQFILIKIYKNYALYKDMVTGVRECFSKFDLGHVKKRDKEIGGINERN